MGVSVWRRGPFRLFHNLGPAEVIGSSIWTIMKKWCIWTFKRRLIRKSWYTGNVLMYKVSTYGMLLYKPGSASSSVGNGRANTALISADIDTDARHTQTSHTFNTYNEYCTAYCDEMKTVDRDNHILSYSRISTDSLYVHLFMRSVYDDCT